MIVPARDQYIDIAQEIITTATSQKVEAIVYGSFCRSNVKFGLSDIDAFVLEETGGYLFSPQIQGIFSVVKNRALMFGIPLQFTWATQKSLGENSIFSQDEGYVSEVRRGCDAAYKTQGINAILGEKGLQGDQYDIGMLRFFHKKIQRLGLMLPNLAQIVQKNEDEITREEQGDLREAWDLLKKSTHLCSLFIRISGKIPEFGLADFDAIDNYSSTHLRELLLRIKSIRDWFYYLKNENGIHSIGNLICGDFEVLFASIDKKLWTKN